MSVRVNPLAIPKGEKYNCELCGKVAFLQCQFCGVTFYCSKDHQTVDWNGIHMKICQAMIPLRTPSKGLGSEEERNRKKKEIKQSQLALLELTKTEAQKHLHEDNCELAIPPALQSLRFAIDLYGPASIELVTSYLLLGEASIGLGRFGQAEEYLSLGKYAILKKPDCSNALRSQLCRNFGKLYFKQGKFDDAVKQLANDIYYSSLETGPENVSCAGGYFHLALVFAARDQHENSLALYEKVVEIWLDGLRNALEIMKEERAETIDEAATAECLQMLMKILSVRENRLGTVHSQTGQSYQALGLLFKYTGNIPKAVEYTQRAYLIFQQSVGAEDPVAQSIHEDLEDLLNSQAELA